MGSAVVVTHPLDQIWGVWGVERKDQKPLMRSFYGSAGQFVALGGGPAVVTAAMKTVLELKLCFGGFCESKQIQNVGKLHSVIVLKS